MRRAICLVVLVALAWLGRPVRAQSLEDEVKAAFLYNFAKFVEWPADAFDSAEEPLTFCLVGRDPFGRVLDELLAGEHIRDRRLAVRRLERVAPGARCHILFVAPSEAERFPAILRAVDRRRVLTVSDSLAFLEAGGHISFFLDTSRVRFAVNQEATDAAEFKMSSKLLQVARRPETARSR